MWQILQVKLGLKSPCNVGCADLERSISSLTAAQAPIYKTKLLFWLVIALYTLGKKIMLKTALTQSRKFSLELPLLVVISPNILIWLL